MPIPNAGADERHPTHHITLDDGENIVGLMIVNGRSDDDPMAIQQNPFPRTSTKIDTGGSKYDDYVPPYKANVSETAEGGRGADIFEDDKTKFGDSNRAYTHFPGQVSLGSSDFYQSNNALKKQNIVWHTVGEDYERAVLYPDGVLGHRWIAMSFVGPTGGYNAVNVELLVKCIGTPGDLKVELWTNSGGSPSTMQRSTTIAHYHDEELYHKLITWSAYTVSAGTTYWIVVIGGASDDGDNHWELMRGNGTPTGKYSDNGSAWSSPGYGFYYRISESITTRKSEGYFFDYRDHKYFVTRNGEIHVNGDRGMADSNSGDKTKLNDSTKSWTTNQFADGMSYAVIINGPGSTDAQNYRLITSNTATALTVSIAWDTAHTVDTEYIIVSPSIWTKVADTFYSPVMSVAEAGNHVYIAHGPSQPVSRYYETRFSGAWTASCIDETLSGISHLKATRHPTDGFILWAAENEHPIYGSVVHKCWVPPLPMAPGVAGVNLYRKLGTLLKGGNHWNEQTVANVTPAFSPNRIALTVGSGVSSGTIIAEKQLSQPVDLSGTSKIIFMINSSIAQSASDIDLVLSDWPIDRRYIPSKVIGYTVKTPPDSLVYFDNSATTKWYPLPQGAYNIPGQYINREMKFTLDTSDELYIGCATRFDKIHCTFSALNNNAATMTVKYWDGVAWQSVSSLSDGTATGGAMLGQNGVISYTLPSDWQQGVDDQTGTPLSESLFYVRISASALLDSVKVKVSVEATGTSLETMKYTEIPIAHDGRTVTDMGDLLIETDFFLFVGADIPFSALYFDLGSSKNSNAATVTLRYFDGYTWATVSNVSDGTASAGKTLAQNGSITFTTPTKWVKNTVNGELGYWIRMTVSAALTAVDINEINIKTSPGLSLPLPALVAGRDEWIDLGLSASYLVGAGPDMSAIKYVGLRYDRSSAACTIQLIGDLLYGQEPKWDDENVIQTGLGNEKINGLETYGDERANCWVLKQASFGEIQGENDDVYVPVPLFELGAMRSTDNGLAHCTNDVNLIFTLGAMRVQQYFNRTLVDIGPDSGEGLPLQRQGKIMQLLSTPAGILAGIDAGDPAGAAYGNHRYSSVLMRRGSGWHELYRFPSGQRFRQMSLQTMPGDLPARLWMACGDGDMKCIFVPRKSKRPDYDTNMMYAPESSFIIPWVTTGYLELMKLFSYLSMYTSASSANSGTKTRIKVDYQLETGDWYQGWTNIGYIVDDEPWHQLSIGSLGVKGRRIRLRFRLETDTCGLTPVLKSWVLDSLLRFPVKYSYSFSTRLADEDIDLTGNPDVIARASDKINLLKGWSTPPTALRFRCSIPAYDNRYVVIEPLPGKPYAQSIVDNRENHIYQITLLEL